MAKNIGFGLQVVEPTDAIRDGDNVISSNAVATKAAFDDTRARLAVMEIAAGFDYTLGLTDQMVAPLIADKATATSGAIEGVVNRSVVTFTPSKSGVPADGASDATPQFQSFLDGLPDGAVVQSQPTDVYQIAGTLNLNRPVTLRGGRFLPADNAASIRICADDVTLDSFHVSGINAAVGPMKTSQNFIMSNGTQNDKRYRTKIRNLVMAECKYTFMFLDWLADFTIAHNSMTNGQYAGIIMISPKGGRIFDNTVRNMMQGGTLVNSYGITCTDWDNTAAARSEDVDISGNTIDGVRNWEGIDTHGGKNIKIIGNTVKNVRCPIAVTTGNSKRLLPPQDCTVIGNYLEKGNANSERAGIVFNSNTDNPIPCSGVIGENIIRGFILDLDLINWDPERTTVAPQNTSSGFSGSHFSPTPAAFRSYQVEASVPLTNGSGSVLVTFPPGCFTKAPQVQVTKATSTGVSLGTTPWVNAVSATSCVVGLYDAARPNHALTQIPVSVTVTQASSASSGGVYRV